MLLGEVSNPEKEIYGAGAHSDYGLITLLLTDEVLGLQVGYARFILVCNWVDLILIVDANFLHFWFRTDMQR